MARIIIAVMVVTVMATPAFGQVRVTASLEKGRVLQGEPIFVIYRSREPWRYQLKVAGRVRYHWEADDRSPVIGGDISAAMPIEIATATESGLRRALQPMVDIAMGATSGQFSAHEALVEVAPPFLAAEIAQCSRDGVLSAADALRRMATTTRSRAAVPALIDALTRETASDVCSSLRVLTHRRWCDDFNYDPAARRRQLRREHPFRSASRVVGGERQPSIHVR